MQKRSRAPAPKSYLLHTLHAIRAKRLSVDAPAKGLFPDRTPSITVMSTISKMDKEEPAAPTAPPLLSLTKLDFELLREWDWKERKKRLESWKDDLGLGEKHDYQKRGKRGSQQSDNDRRRGSSASQDSRAPPEERRGSKGQRKSGQTRTRLILKKEIEGITGMRVHPPEEAKKKREPSQTDRSSKKSSTKANKLASSYLARHQQKMEKVDRELEKVADRARANELKSAFGKGWGTGKPSNTNLSAVRRPSARLSTRLSTRPLGTRVTQSELPRVSAPLIEDHHHRHRHHPPAHVHAKSRPEMKTDGEEEQASTSYMSHTSRTHTTADSGSPTVSPTGSAGSIGLTALFRSLHEAREEGSDEDDDKKSSGEASDKVKSPKKFEKRPQQVEFQDTCFGGIKFVERQGVQPLTKKKQGHEFYMTFDDTDLGLGLGKTQHLKIRFFKPGGLGKGRSDRILAREERERTKKAREAELKRLKKEKEEEERQATLAAEEEQIKRKTTIRSFSELPAVLQINEQDRKKYSEKLAALEKAIMKIPGIGSGYRIEVEQMSKAPSQETTAAVGRLPRRNQYTRPPRRVWYTPLPLTVKKYYRTNWKKIRFDVRKEMRERGFWPKLWINFEETHPKKLYELIHAKLAVKQFDMYGFKKDFDWGRGIHPDYIDWILEDIVPHPGKYYYDEESKDPIRRASFEESDFQLKNWFMKPPRYIPGTPLSPPFDQFDFCGYGNRENAYFLDFTLPREILHYYAPPSDIERFFREIPKPPYAFPGYTFKRWLKYPLEKKLPQYYPFPKRFSIWTRGKIGDPIQCNSKEFKLDDPLLTKRDLSYNPYHDPHTKKFFLRKSILDRIWELGVINSKGEVKCTMKEFNQNRQYLRDYEWLEECLKRWTLKWVTRLQHNRLTKDTNIALMDWDSKTRIWHERLERTKVFKRIREHEEQKHNRRLEQRYEKAVNNAFEVKKQIQHEMIVRAKRKRKEQRARKRNLHAFLEGRIQFLQQVYEQRHKKSLKNTKHYQLTKIVEKLETRKDTWSRHCEFARRKMEEMRELQKKLEQEHLGRIEIRKRRIQRMWKEIPYLAARHREHLRAIAEREHYLAAKYFKIWRDNVKKRTKLYEDGKHTTAWHDSHFMENYVQYMKDMLGYINVENEVFSMVRNLLKKAKEKKVILKDVQPRKKLQKSIHFKVEREIHKLIRGKKEDQYEAEDSDSDEDVDQVYLGETEAEFIEDELNDRVETAGYDADLDEKISDYDDDGVK